MIEHLPTDSLASIEHEMGNLLKKDGKIILTYPSPVFQEFLRQNQPEAIQIIDNDIGIRQVYELAERIDAEVTYLKWITIWRKNDYVHVVLDRKPDFGVPRGGLFKKTFEFLRRKIRAVGRKNV